MIGARAGLAAVTVLAAIGGLAGAWSVRRAALQGVGGAGASAPPAHPRAPFESAATVDPAAPFDGEVSRRILALYDSSETVAEEDDHGHVVDRPVDPEVAAAHRLAELPLNHLGLVLDWHDVNSGELPGPQAMARYLGVLVWLGDERMRAPEDYLSWLREQLQAGRRVVIMERLGARADLEGRAAPADLQGSVLAALGATYEGDDTDDGSLIAVVEADSRVMGFERSMPPVLEYYQRWRAGADAKVYLRLERTDLPGTVSDAVFTTPRGGFVLPGVAYTEDRLGDRHVLRWLVDPFVFFDSAFGVAGWPRPDFTTAGGRRIFYSQIDGDGLDTISEIDRKSTCGELIRDRILARHDLPVTASVVVGLTAPPPLGKGSRHLERIARSIFALDNVEVGSHGLAHPMNWRAGAAAELSVPGLPGYVLSGESEIAHSVDYIDRVLAPPGKRCQIMLWTGWCNPSPEQLAVAYRLGLRNLNGGDPRMDAHYPSYAHLVPPVRRTGEFSQYLTSAANDFILTNEWTPPYYRYQNVVQTFERSGRPRRVVPIDVYYHFYIALNQAALAGLEHVLGWVIDQPIAPRWTSEYVDIVRDFQWARLARRAGDEWVLRKGPALRTLRFDDAGVHVDLDRSPGVIGYTADAELGVTWVHLDASPEVVVRLSDTPPRRAYLKSASHPVDDLRVEPGVLDFGTGGPGRREFVFAGLAHAQRARIVSATPGQAERRSEAVVDERGVLGFAIDGAGAGDARVRVELLP